MAVQSNKWKDFKQRKIEIVDAYIASKRKSLGAQNLLKNLFILKIMKKQIVNMDKKKRDRRELMYGKMVAVILWMKCGRNIRKQHGLYNFQRNKIRSSLTMLKQLKGDQ